MGVLAGVVRQAALRFGATPAFVATDGWSLSYADLDRISDETAVGLAHRGVTAGDVVVLLLPSTPDYVVAYAALAKLGAITAGINPGLAPPERAHLVDLVSPRYVLATADLASDLDVIQVDAAGAASQVLRDLRVPGATPELPAEDPDRPVALVFTSGTTGVAKAAVFTDHQLDAIRRIEIGDAWGGGPPALVATQFAHVGFMTKLPWTLRLGGTTHLLRKWRAADVLDLVERARIPSIGAIAPQLALMLADPRFDERDLSHVRTVTAGGSASPPALIDEARRRFDAEYVVRYSSTESGGVGTGTGPGASDDELFNSVGRPRPGVEVEIRDGEVCLRSPAVMAGYWNDPGADASTLEDGRLHTGDLGEIDSEGRLRLLGRRKEMFIRGGYNVFPVEVEAALASHRAVGEIVVVPRPDPVMGEVGVAFVVPRPDAKAPSLQDLRDYGRRLIAAWKLPEDMRILEQLPRTAGQKVDRRKLAAELSTEL